MRNFYYELWTDAILSFRKHHPERKDWKLSIYSFYTLIMALNLWIIMLWLKYFSIIEISSIKIDIFPGNVIDEFLSFAIIFASPFIVINYFLIFYKDRYEKIIKKYDRIYNKFAFRYSIIIALGAFVSAILYIILN